MFGDYVSISNFADAATLPLYYENRIPEVSLSRENLGNDILEILDNNISIFKLWDQPPLRPFEPIAWVRIRKCNWYNTDLTDEQQAKLETEFARAYHVITRNDRLDTIAKDLVNIRGFTSIYPIW